MQEKSQALPAPTSSHQDGCGHRAALAELDICQHAFPVVAYVNVLIEVSLTDHSTVLGEDL